jgi:hypothetical protein
MGNRTLLPVFGLVFLLRSLIPVQAHGQGAKEATPQNVASAIDSSVSYLIREQVKNEPRAGSWEGHDTYGCGQTCLVTLALLSSGVDVKSAVITRALRFIRATKPRKTYEAALQVMVLCAAEPARDSAKIKEIIEWLVGIQTPSGGWNYGDSPGGPDESNSQFAVLALWEASKLGISIPEACFQKGQQYWETNAIGEGWGYGGRGQPTGSMTCAGIASMIILQDASAGSDASIQDKSIQCCGNQNNKSFNLDRPLQWLAKNFSATNNPNAAAHTYYYLYALERVGRLTGQRLIGERDWYREGCKFLLNSQGVGGFFQGGTGEEAVTATSMALLFLSKGKRQVVIGHLQYGAPNSGDWNLHRRSVQNLTGHIEKVWKRELAWQTIRLEKADTKALLETPVLFISGTKAFEWTVAQRKTLKEYVEQGGLIFAEACNGDGCNGEAFDQAFRREMETIFDKPLQKLPPSHPVWSAEAKVDPKALPNDFWLYGIDACCRTSVVYSPISLSCRWELMRPYGRPQKLAAAVDADLQNAVKIGVNVVAYATGRELKEKLDAVQVIQPQANPQALVRGALTMPKIRHSGGDDDTPKAVGNLMEVFRRESQAIVDGRTPMISLGQDREEIEKHPILYIHGRSKFVFSDAERQGLKTHIENGGFVIGDSICASREFSEALKREFSQSLPNSSWKKIETKHAVMVRNGPVWFDLGNVALVDSSGVGDMKQATREGPADLDGLEWNGRLVMLFSPNDLSCAMESKHSLQCRGYIRDDAFKIGINMILYALTQQ